MTVLRQGQRSLGASLGVLVSFALVACVSGELGENGENGTAGKSGSGTGGSGAVGTGGVGGTGTGGSLGGTGGSGVGGTTGGVGGAGAVGGATVGGGAGVGAGGASGSAGMSAGGTTGGVGPMSGSGGSMGGSAGTGATGGTGGTGSNCTDTPPPNGDTCANAVAFGWCGQDWMNGACALSCNMCMGGGSGGSGGTGGGSTGGSGGTGGGSTGGTGGGGTGGSGGGTVTQPPPNINTGQQAWASRYWDCCKPACGWSANAGGTPMKSCSEQNQRLGDNDARNACESGGSAYMCWDGRPRCSSDDGMGNCASNDQLSYGFVAASGGNYVCGRCFHLQFTGSGHSGNNPGAQAINGKHMIVQVINNGGVESNQFDLLIPGGGVGLLNACDTQWGNVNLGEQYGGFHRTCNNDINCTRQMCQAAFGNKPELMAGCNWFLGWYAGADNPNVVYERIACPSALTQISGLSDR